jgi:hypothetical protein
LKKEMSNEKNTLIGKLISEDEYVKVKGCTVFIKNMMNSVMLLIISTRSPLEMQKLEE